MTGCGLNAPRWISISRNIIYLFTYLFVHHHHVRQGLGAFPVS